LELNNTSSDNVHDKRLSVTNLSSENNLLMFRLNALVVIKAKVKEVQTNIAICSLLDNCTYHQRKTPEIFLTLAKNIYI